MVSLGVFVKVLRQRYDGLEFKVLDLQRATAQRSARNCIEFNSAASLVHQSKKTSKIIRGLM